VTFRISNYQIRCIPVEISSFDLVKNNLKMWNMVHITLEITDITEKPVHIIISVPTALFLQYAQSLPFLTEKTSTIL
jgi:hypothetical protein